MLSDFNIGLAGALRGGLPVHGADAGILRVGAAFSLDQLLSRKWQVDVRVHYARLMGSAADSPVTNSAGSPNQAFIGPVVGYVLQILRAADRGLRSWTKPARRRS